MTLFLRSTAQMFNGSASSNTGNAILLGSGGALSLTAPGKPPPTAVTVTGNGGSGLQCFGAEASFEGDISGISGNVTGQVSPNCTGF